MVKFYDFCTRFKERVPRDVPVHWISTLKDPQPKDQKVFIAEGILTKDRLLFLKEEKYYGEFFRYRSMGSNETISGIHRRVELGGSILVIATDLDS